MLKKALYWGVLPLMLAACGTAGKPQAAQDAGDAVVFACDNGMQASVRPQGGDAVHLEVAGQGMMLKQAVSASGERYVAADGRTEWHQKGDEAYFAFAAQDGTQRDARCKVAQ